MEKERKKVGRPPLAKGEAKAIVLQSRVQPAEKQKLSKGCAGQRKRLVNLDSGDLE